MGTNYYYDITNIILSRAFTIINTKYTYLGTYNIITKDTINNDKKYILHI